MSGLRPCDQCGARSLTCWECRVRDLAALEAERDQARALYEKAMHTIGVLDAEATQARARVAELEAEVEEAWAKRRLYFHERNERMVQVLEEALAFVMEKPERYFVSGDLVAHIKAALTGAPSGRRGP